MIARHLPVIDACWSRIGVRGDRSCAKLAEVVHCHGCPVFSAAAAALLDREAPDDYVAELTEHLAMPGEADRGTVRSAVFFRVGAERFAVPAEAVLEVADTAAPRRIPHRHSAVLRGVVTIRGRLELCVSLAGLFGLPDASTSGSTGVRVLVVTHDNERWGVLIDALHGVDRYHATDMLDAPITARWGESAYVSALLVSGAERFGLLDMERVCAGLRAGLV